MVWVIDWFPKPKGAPNRSKFLSDKTFKKKVFWNYKKSWEKEGRVAGPYPGSVDLDAEDGDGAAVALAAGRLHPRPGLRPASYQYREVLADPVWNMRS